MTSSPRSTNRRLVVLGLVAAAAALGGCTPSGPVAAPPSSPYSALSSPSDPTTVPDFSTEPSTTLATPPPPPPPPPPPLGPRPATGHAFVRTGSSGRGELVVRNGNTDDGYVTLASGGQARLAVYVRADDTARVRHIADGTYDVYFSTGAAWSNPLRAFTSDVQAAHFDQTLPFDTTSRGATEWTLTLNPVPDGNAASSPVDPATVPR